MFVVEVGSVLTTVLLRHPQPRSRTTGHFGFNLQITLWLWFTVLFANFAEAMAEGRGKAQADALRQAKSETTAYRRRERRRRGGSQLAASRRTTSSASSPGR